MLGLRDWIPESQSRHWLEFGTPQRTLVHFGGVAGLRVRRGLAVFKRQLHGRHRRPQQHPAAHFLREVREARLYVLEGNGPSPPARPWKPPHRPYRRRYQYRFRAVVRERREVRLSQTRFHWQMCRS